MNRKIILTFLALALVLMATPYMEIVRATRPISFSFEHWALGYGVPEYRQAGNNWISDASSYGVVTVISLANTLEMLIGYTTLG